MDKNRLFFFLKYGVENWKMLIHLFLGTYRFGVNNEFWGGYRSLFGRPAVSKISKLVHSFKLMRARAFMGFIPLNDAIRLFPAYAKKMGYKPIKMSTANPEN